jgi:hypothetical protein
MVAIPLAHLSWAIADNADRKACDAFVIDTFGAGRCRGKAGFADR